MNFEVKLNFVLSVYMIIIITTTKKILRRSTFLDMKVTFQVILQWMKNLILYDVNTKVKF